MSQNEDSQNDDSEKLLTEIRDALREQLDEYRRVSAQALENSRISLAANAMIM